MSANDKQIGGKHYQQAIQPWDYVAANNLGYFEGNVVKYVSRWKEKNGIVDLKKAVHYLEKLIELEEKKVTYVIRASGNECDPLGTATENNSQLKPFDSTFEDVKRTGRIG